MCQTPVDEWRMPFVFALPIIHANLTRMFAVRRNATLLGADASKIVYDAYDEAARRRFFDERLKAVYNDVKGRHVECEAAALARLVVAAADTRHHRVSVALVVNWRVPANKKASVQGGGCTRVSLAESLALAQRYWQVHTTTTTTTTHECTRRHLVAIVWPTNAATSPNSSHQTRFAPSDDERRRITTALSDANLTDVSVEMFDAREFLYDPIDHVLQPRTICVYEPSTIDEAERTIDDYDHLRRLQSTDAVWRRFGCRTGTIIAYERTDPRLGTSWILRVGDYAQVNDDDRRVEFARLRKCARQKSTSSST